MRFFNNKQVPVSFRFDGFRNIIVKPNTLSPFIDFYNLNKNNVKYIFSNFPVLFDSETERNKFEKKRVPYKLYKEIDKKEKVLVEEQPQMPEVVATEDNDRFLDSNKMEVEEVKILEPKENKMGGAIISVEKSIFETKEEQKVSTKRKREDQEEDVLSGELERILEIPKSNPVKPKAKDNNIFSELVSEEGPKFSGDKKHKTDLNK